MNTTIPEFAYEITTTHSIELLAEAIDMANPLGFVPENTRIAVVEAKDRWVRVRAQQVKGWVRVEKLPEFQSILRKLKRVRAELVPPHKLELVRRLVGRALHKRPDLQAALNGRIDRLFTNVETLNRLAEAAFGFMRGGPGAERSFDRQMDLLEIAAQPIPRPESFVGLFPREIPGDIDFPIRPRLPFKMDCFIDLDDYATLFGALMRRSFPGNTPVEALDGQWRMVAPLTPLLRDLELAESLYQSAAAAMKVGDSQGAGFKTITGDLEVLAAHPSNDDRLLSQLQPISADFVPGFAFPGFDIPGLPGFDACRAQRWEETYRLLSCICEESYRIERIVNLDRPSYDGSERVGEGCSGDWVRIEGWGFGSNRDWGLGLGQSEVLFEGAGFTEVQATEFMLWSENAVEVRVPGGIQAGNISLRILCANHSGDCTGIVFRSTVPGSNRYLDLMPPPEFLELSIETVEYGRRVIASPRGTEVTFNARRCETVIVGIVAENIESISLTDLEGSEIEVPGGGPGPRRRIETEVLLSAPESRELLLQLNAGCSPRPPFRLIENREHWLTVRLPAVSVLTSGQRATYGLRLSCPPLDWGLSEAVVTISSSEETLLEPEQTRIVFAAGEVEKDVIFTARDGCGHAVVIIRLEPGSRPAVLEEGEWENRIHVAVIDALVISGLSAPFGLGPCGRNIVELIAECLPEPAVIMPRIVGESGRSIGIVVRSNIVERDGNRAVIQIGWDDPLTPGHTYRFGITAGYGGEGGFIPVIESNLLPLRTGEAPRMMLRSYSANPGSAEGYIVGRLRVEVMFARRIEIYRMELGTLGGHRRGELIGSINGADRCSPDPLVLETMARYAGYSRFQLVAYDFELSSFDPDAEGPHILKRELTISYMTPSPPPDPIPITFRSLTIVNSAPFKVNVYVSRDLGDYELKTTLQELVRGGVSATHTLRFEEGSVYLVALWSINSEDDLGGECRGNFSDNAWCLKGIVLSTRPDTLVEFWGAPDGLDDFYEVL